MAWLSVDKDGTEKVHIEKPYISHIEKTCISPIANGEYDSGEYVPLPKGTIKKILGRELSWSDEPVEIKE